MEPKRQTGDATGGPSTKFEKPTDKPPKQYTANETTPRDNFHEEPVDSSFENPGDLSTRFMK